MAQVLRRFNCAVSVGRLNGLGWSHAEGRDWTCCTVTLVQTCLVGNGFVGLKMDACHFAWRGKPYQKTIEQALSSLLARELGFLSPVLLLRAQPKVLMHQKRQLTEGQAALNRDMSYDARTDWGLLCKAEHLPRRAVTRPRCFTW